MMRKAFYILGALVLSGCYTYVPAPPSSVAEGDKVRFHLTDDEGQRLSGLLGPQISAVAGTVTERQQDRVQLTVEGFRTVQGGEIFGASRALTLDLAAIRTAERKQLDRIRTVVFAIGLVALPIVIGGSLDLFSKKSPQDGGTGQPPPPQ